MDLVADVLFDNNVFIPENPDGTLKSTPLQTSFRTTISNWNNLMVALTIEPFQIKGLTGVGFSVTNAVFDMSDFHNPANITFGDHYANYFIDGNKNTWQGIYIQEAQIRLPRQFRKKSASDNQSGDRLTFYAQNLLIDHFGFTGSLAVSRLMTIDEGDLDGWAFSVDNLYVNIEASKLISGGFTGQIRVPLFEESSLLNYSAVMGMNGTYSFKASITEQLEMDMWAAKLSINPNSAITLSVENDRFVPSLLLNGKISINASFDKSDEASPKLSIVDIPFEGMRIQTVAPYFGVDHISFGTGQNRFSNFPVSIRDIEFLNINDRHGLRLALRVNFTDATDGGFGGDGMFTVWGKKELGGWQYDGVEVDRILVDISKPGAFTLKGGVMFIRGDPVYGNGFKGVLQSDFAGFGMDAVALFGTVDNYRYYFADAFVSTGTGIPMGQISIYGIGGGLNYRMKQTGIGGGASDIGRSNTGINYVPDRNAALGFKAMVQLGMTGDKKPFNGDVEFGLTFTKHGGIDNIYFQGNAYFITGGMDVTSSGLLSKAASIVGRTESAVPGPAVIPKDDDRAQLYGDVYISLDFTNKVYKANFSIHANVAGGLIRGTGANNRAGWGAILFSPDDWFIHIGRPDNRNGIQVLNLATMTNYFMVGKTVPEMPPPPANVQNFLGKSYTAPRSMEMINGSGFAMGASFDFDTGERNFLLFYGRIGCGIGFDILLKNYGAAQCAGGGTLGINGWYAQGQAYAWLAAAIGIRVSLPFYSGRYEILSLQTASLLQVKAPNPFWLKGAVGGTYNILGGLVKGRCNFEFEIGTQCEIINSSPLGGIPIIADISPADNANDVNVFTTPQAIFNMPLDRRIEFKDANQITKTYRIMLRSFTVTANGAPVAGVLTWNDKRDVVTFKSSEILPGNSTGLD